MSPGLIPCVRRYGWFAGFLAWWRCRNGCVEARGVDPIIVTLSPGESTEVAVKLRCPWCGSVGLERVRLRCVGFGRVICDSPGFVWRDDE